MPTRFGKYTLIRKLATGGMAELFLAIQKSVAGFEKLLVIKRILPSMNQDQAFIEMLLHEARIAATLSHPNIVQTFDVGQVDGQYFIAMEHVHGEDLRSIVRQMKKKGVGEFPIEHALSIVLGMCAGLAHAHEKRALDGTHLAIVHRDISPQNLVVAFTGDVKIVDFGIAKSDTRVGEQTKSGRLKGKVPYMSPEQARGEVLDARSDIFATGTMLFELTTGKRLFKAQSEYETLKLICEREYPRPSDVRSDYAPDLEAIVMRALAKDPSRRYQSAREMQADLETFIRRHQVAVSSLALCQFMQSLFEEKLAMQKEALQQGKQLADIIELEQARLSISDASDIDVSVPRVTSSISMPVAVRTLTDASAPSRVPTTHAAVIGGLIATVLVVAGALVGASYVLAKKNDTTDPTPASRLPLAKGSLSMTSDPPGASIWINGSLQAEVTPATISDLPTGIPLDVKLTLDGFDHDRQKLTLTDTQLHGLNVELKKSSFVVDVRLVPDNVTNPIFEVDGKASLSPHIEDVASGISHKLTVNAPGYAETSVSFTGAPHETRHLEVKLEKLTDRFFSRPTPPAGNGKLNVGAAGGWCNVTVDGIPRGATPVAGVELAAGSHKVTCTTPDGKMRDATVNVQTGDTSRYKFTL